MPKKRYVFMLLGALLYAPVSFAQVSIGIGLPHLSIGINLPVYPRLVAVPGYPVYYAPGLSINYFFYDGMYWVYQDNDWYASSWYDGPWYLVNPVDVPLFILRIPVRYYRNPPPYFRGWRADAPPRWGEHWGPRWQEQRRGWDNWNRRAVPARAPLPAYQQHYREERYPRQVEQQRQIERRDYRYQPRDPRVRELYQERATQRTREESRVRQQPVPQPAQRMQQPPGRGEEYRGAPGGGPQPRMQGPQNREQRAHGPGDARGPQHGGPGQERDRERDGH